MNFLHIFQRDPLDPIREALARKELLYQAQLLEKDRELHKVKLHLPNH
jgi:hypothetical protein